MSDFDITRVRGKSSFMANLKKRKALGLDDSDSDEDLFPKKKDTNKGKVPDTLETGTATTASSTANQPLEDKSSESTQGSNSLANNNNSNASTKPPSATETATQSTSFTDPHDSNTSFSITEDSPKQLDASPPTILLEDEIPTHSPPEPEPEPFMDDLDLDPELAALLSKNYQSEEQQYVEPPKKIKIKLQYTHNFKTLSPVQLKIMESLIKPMKIFVMNNDQFKIILNAFCKHKKLLKQDVILVYKENYVYPSSTPAGVGMNEFGTNHMQVYLKKCYDQMQQEKELERQKRFDKFDTGKDGGDDIFQSEEFMATSTTNEQSNGESANHEHDNRIFLILRGKESKEVKLRVNPTSTVQMVIKAYQDFAGVTANIKLNFDGEDLQPGDKIEDTELEDEVLVDVILLK